MFENKCEIIGVEGVLRCRKRAPFNYLAKFTSTPVRILTCAELTIVVYQTSQRIVGGIEWFGQWGKNGFAVKEGEVWNFFIDVRDNSDL